MQTEIYYHTRKLIRDNCNDKKDLMIDEYEKFNDVINGLIKCDEISDNLSFDYDSILDINDSNKFEMFESRLFDRYINNLFAIYKYNLKCKQINVLRKTKLNYDIIYNIIFKFL